MNAEKVMVLSDILQYERRQYIIPIYQREYKWKTEQILRLLDDIILCAKTNKEHFIGSLVCQSIKENALTGNSFYLVDGQQRLTTMMLIIKALNLIAKEIYESSENENAFYVMNKTRKAIFVDEDKPSAGFKIKPSLNDQNVFNSIISAKKYDDIISNPSIEKNNLLFNNFLTAYSYLKKKILDGYDIEDEIYSKGLLNLSIVAIKIEYFENAQEIFESLNSLGVPLTNSDLIRNYLLMSNENQQELYIEKWSPMQNKLIGEDNMEMFIKNYLLMKRSYAINDKDVYKEYVKYANSKFNNGEIDRNVLICDLFDNACLFVPFIKYSNDYNLSTNKLMEELRDMDQTTAYPFLMRVFEDHKNKIIDDVILDKVINLIIVYLVRRTVCRVPTNTLRGFMLTLYNRVFKVKANKNKYYESIYCFLLRTNSNDYLRSEDEFKKELVLSPIYKNVKFATYLLFKIENGRYPNIYSEFSGTDQPTVEHIMPQHLTDSWVNDLGENSEEIHKMYLNTLGNLSLSSRSKNSSMSDESFEVKKSALSGEGSKFDVLNKGIESLPKFGEKEILDREKRLSEILISKFSLGEVDIRGIKFEESYSVEIGNELNPIFYGASPLSFIFLGEEYAASSYSQILVKLTKMLLKLYPEVIRDLASKGYNPWSSNGDKKYLYYADENSKDQIIGDGIMLNTVINAMYSMDFCAHLLNECGLESNELEIILKKDSIKRENMIKKSEKVILVRKSLQKLKDENLIIYDPESMPKSDSWIKFQINSLLNIFKSSEETKWDGENFNSIYFNEFVIGSNYVVITLKYLKQDRDLLENIKSHAEELQIVNDDLNSEYWHLRKIKIDLDEVLKHDGDEAVAELANQIKKIIKEYDNFAEKLSKII